MSTWTVIVTEEWLAGIRQDLDVSSPAGALNYDGTADGSWSFVGAQASANTSQHIADAFSAHTLATAGRTVTVSRALDRGLLPRAATFSTLEVALVTGAGGVLEVGTRLRVTAGTVNREDQEQGLTFPFPDSEWLVLENLQPGELLDPSDTVVIQCTTAGRVTVSNPLDLTPDVAIDGIETLRYSGGESREGRAAERTSELKARIRDARANKAGTDPGLVSALRDDVTLAQWLLVAAVDSTPGFVRVNIAPGPPTDADEQRLAEVIQGNRAGGAITLGDQSRVIPADTSSGTVTISWDVGGTTVVNIGLTVTPADGVSAADALSAARDAISEVFVTLGPGRTLYWLDAYGSLRITPLKGAVLTLNGTQNLDIVPPGVNTLTPAFA